MTHNALPTRKPSSVGVPTDGPNTSM